jgi:3'-phosphoadenosine 5'-phosphosulfate sulfotransferase (PAPS reductase)/FAD synthetase
LESLQEAAGRIRTSGRYILSFGCGVNTVALMIHLVNEGMPFDEAVFADTGGELPETYDYLKIARRYLSRHGKQLKVVRSGNGALMDTCTRRRVIPSQVWRWSTRDYKITPIHAYYRSLGVHIHEYMGIAYDEITRLKRSSQEYITTLFPLVDSRFTRADCVRIIEAEGLPVPPKSGCYFCPFNNVERWAELRARHPRLYEKAIALEEQSKYFPRQTLVDPHIKKRLGVSGLRELGEDLNARGAHSTPEQDSPCSGYCLT